MAKTFCLAELLETFLKNGSGGSIRPFEFFSWYSAIDSGGFFFADITGISERKGKHNEKKWLKVTHDLFQGRWRFKMILKTEQLKCRFEQIMGMQEPTGTS